MHYIGPTLKEVQDHHQALLDPILFSTPGDVTPTRLMSPPRQSTLSNFGHQHPHDQRTPPPSYATPPPNAFPALASVFLSSLAPVRLSGFGRYTNENVKEWI